MNGVFFHVNNFSRYSCKQMGAMIYLNTLMLDIKVIPTSLILYIVL